MRSSDVFSMLAKVLPVETYRAVENHAIDICGGIEGFRDCRDAQDGIYTGKGARSLAARFRVGFKRALRVHGFGELCELIHE